MSGQKKVSRSSSRTFVLSASERDEVARNVRSLSGIEEGRGPSNERLATAVQAFTAEFEFWYVRVMAEAVPQYRRLVICRINPFIRRIEFDGFSSVETATRLVEDYSRRNFVTAGGWALERLAIGISPSSQKALAEGIDIQRFDPATGAYHLYVLKSGMVTRNSDIVGALKRNARKAEKLLRQGDAQVIANWAVAAGKSSTTFEDGIRRPSSAEFWSEMTELPPDEAIELVLAVAAEAGRLVRRDATVHINAMVQVVAEYIASPDDPGKVDWEFIARVTMREKMNWKVEDEARHKRAMGRLKVGGYSPIKRGR
jgi:hypothetical protein